MTRSRPVWLSVADQCLAKNIQSRYSRNLLNQQIVIITSKFSVLTLLSCKTTLYVMVKILKLVYMENGWKIKFILTVLYWTLKVSKENDFVSLFSYSDIYHHISKQHNLFLVLLRLQRVSIDFQMKDEKFCALTFFFFLSHYFPLSSGFVFLLLFCCFDLVLLLVTFISQYTYFFQPPALDYSIFLVLEEMKKSVHLHFQRFFLLAKSLYFTFLEINTIYRQQLLL